MAGRYTKDQVRRNVLRMAAEGASEEEIDAYVRIVQPHLDMGGAGSSYGAPTSDFPVSKNTGKPLQLPGAVVMAEPPEPDPLPPARGATRTFGEPTILDRVRKTRDEFNARQKEIEEQFPGPFNEFGKAVEGALAGGTVSSIGHMADAAGALSDAARKDPAVQRIYEQRYGAAPEVPAERSALPRQMIELGDQIREDNAPKVATMGEAKSAGDWWNYIQAKGGEAVGSTASTIIGYMAGGVPGAALASYVQNTGDIRGELEDLGVNGEKKEAVAFALGIPIAALDALPIDAVAGMLKKQAAELAAREIAAPSIAKAAGRAAGVGVLTETPTEATQEGLQHLGTRAAAGQPVTEGLGSRVLEAGVSGAVGGALLGGASGAVAGAQQNRAQQLMGDNNGIEMPLESPAASPPVAPPSVADMEIPVGIAGQQPQPTPKSGPIRSSVVFRVTALGKDGAQFTSEPPAPEAPGYDISDALISENMEPDAAKAQGFDGARLPDGSLIVWKIQKLKPLPQQAVEEDPIVNDIRARTDIGPAEKESLVKEYRTRKKQLETQGVLGQTREAIDADESYQRPKEEDVEAVIEPAEPQTSEPTPILEAKVDGKATPAPEDENDIRVIARRAREFEERTKAEWYRMDPSLWDDEEKQRWLDASPTDRLWMVVHRANARPLNSVIEGAEEVEEIQGMTAMAVDRFMQEGVPITESFREWEVKVTPEVEKVAAAIERDRGKKPVTPQLPPPGGKYVLPSFVTDPHKKPEKSKGVLELTREAQQSIEGTKKKKPKPLDVRNAGVEVRNRAQENLHTLVRAANLMDDDATSKTAQAIGDMIDQGKSLAEGLRERGLKVTPEIEQQAATLERLDRGVQEADVAAGLYGYTREQLRKARQILLDQGMTEAEVQALKKDEIVARAFKEVPDDAGPQKAEKSGPREIGRNADGDPVYEDQRGVRSVVRNGVRVEEPVTIAPGRDGPRYIVDSLTDKSPEFRTAEEQETIEQEADRSGRGLTAEEKLEDDLSAGRLSQLEYDRAVRWREYQRVIGKNRQARKPGDDIDTFDEWLVDEFGRAEAERILGRAPEGRFEPDRPPMDAWNTAMADAQKRLDATSDEEIAKAVDETDDPMSRIDSALAKYEGMNLSPTGRAKKLKLLARKAEILGKRAFEKGLKPASALDPDFQPLLKGIAVGEAKEILKAWSKGWTEANLAAPTGDAELDRVLDEGRRGPQKPTTKPPREFSSTQFDLPQDVADKVRALGAQIPDNDLAEDGREDKPHLTVKFGLHADDPSTVVEKMGSPGPITVTLGAASVFPNGESGAGDVVKLDVHGQDLRKLNKALAELPNGDVHPKYVPHVTVAYVKPGLGEKYAKQIGVALYGTKVTFDALTFSGKDRQKVALPLGEPQTSDQEAPSETLEPVREAVSGDAPAEQAGAVPEAARGREPLRPRLQDRPEGEPDVRDASGPASGDEPAAGGRRPEGAADDRDRERGPGSGDERDAGEGRGDGESGERRGLRVARNLVITPELEQSIGKGGAIARTYANIAAIRMLKEVEAAQRPATADEQAELVRYVGWGGLKSVFDERKDSPTQQELREILTPEEYAAARASVLNAHYTSIPVIRAIWAGMRRLGFTGRTRILEPSMGVGHFLGALPDGLRSAATTGIELDSITGRIAKLLYPESAVHVAGFEAVPIAENSFDIAISNIPFGEYPVADKKYPRNIRTFIHNYFFAKAIDVVRPGGVVAFITSKGTMDGSTAHAVREYLAKKSKLVAAFRLPNTAFKGNAGTEVTTDIIIVQKLMPGDQPGGESWLDVKRDWTNAKGETIPLNEYFVRNPSHMLGEMTLAGTMYGPGQATLEPFEGAVLGDQLTQVMKSLPEGIVKAAPAVSPATRDPVVKPGIDITPEDQRLVRDGGFLNKQGKLYQRDGDRLVADPVSAKHVDRVARLAKIKHLYQEVRELQTANADEQDIQTAQRRLTKEYDDFVKKYGLINKEVRTEVKRGSGEPTVQIRLPNLQHFTDDPEFPRVTALERYDRGTGKATKADIFTKRVLGVRQERPQITSAVDALPVVLNEAGGVDLKRIADLASVTEDEALEQLGTLVYRDPIKGAWQTADQYLSGNVREKLKEAKRLARIRPELARNVEALEKVQPEDLKPSQIGAGLGAPWIPTTDIEQFVKDLLGQSADVSHAVNSNIWAVSPRGYAKHAESTNTWGTEKRHAYALIEDALNGRTPTITVRHQDGTTEVDKKGTALAQAKLQAIKDRFAKWIWEDGARAQRLARFYNDNYNVIRLPSFDGSFLELPGAASYVNGKPFALMAHQKSAVWRIIQNGTTLLAHIVGAGKTFTMVAAGMEEKRLGLAKKPMYVVPNHMLNQFSNELLQLYPNAKILVATKDEFTGDERRKFTAKIAAENWDAVIMTHSSFERIPMSKEARRAEVKRQIKELEDDIREMKSGKDEKSIVRELEVALKKLAVRLEEIMAEEKKDDLLDFEELGIDKVFLDEAHLFKNLFIRSRMRGMASLGSQRAFDLYLKSIYLEQVNPGRGLTFATGTPISNSMAEMYTVLRYLAPKALRDRQLSHFDAWAATFGETVTTVELKHTGKYDIVTRFAKFKNLPELLQMFRLVADVQMDPVALGLKRPDLIGGKVETIIAPVTQRLKSFIADLAERAKKLSPATKEIDNHLKITTDGRLAALDMRLVDRTAPADPEGKLALAARKIAEKWRQTKDVKGAQLVFLDVSTPGGGDTEAHIKRGGLAGFSGYEELKRNLIAEGIPAKEIAFMQEADTDVKKERLFDAVREGRVRVLMGSTAKMGAGTNVQNKLVALHHVDVPWKPAEVEQRNGRILRQGNELWNAQLIPGVSISVYATEGSFDVYMWQTVQRKAKFIAQVMQGDLTVREMDDVDEMVLTAAEIMALASDNPLVMEKVTLENELSKLYLLQSAHKDAQFAVQRNIADIEQTIKWRRKEAEAIEKDVARRQETKGDKFRITIRGKEYAERKKAGEVLEALAKDLLDKESEKGSFSETVHDIGKLAGFDLQMRTIVRKGATAVQMSLKGELLYEGGVTGEPTGEGMLASAEAVARRPSAEEVERLRKQIPELEHDLAGYRSKLGEKFDKEADVQTKEARLKEVVKLLTEKEKEGQPAESQQEPEEDEGDIEDDDFDGDGEYGAPEPEESKGFTPPLKAAYLAESGKTYTGITHDRAVEAASEANEPEVQGFPNVSDERLREIEDRMGFVDSRGRYLTRDASYDLFGIDASEYLPDDPLKDDDAEIGAPTTIGNELAGETVAVPGIQRISGPEVIKALADVTEAAGKRIVQRIGRLRGKMLGVWKPKQMVIRTRNANDIAVAAHEVAHAIETLLFGDVKGGPWKKPRAGRNMQKELAQMGKDLYGTRKPAAGYKREGWAEFIRMWVTESSLTGGPMNVSSKAPITHQWFDNEFSKDFPDVREKLEAAREAARRWRLQGSRARAEESIVDAGTLPTRLKRAGQNIRKSLSWSRLVEMAQPLHDLAREAEQNLGRQLRPSEDPFFTISALRTTHDARTKYMVETAMIDIARNRVGPALAEIRQLLKPNQRVDFMVYLWARRALSLATDPKGPRDAGLSVSDAQQIIKELDTPAFQLAAGKVYAWNEGVLNYAAQASPTFAEVVKNVRARDPGNYIPLQREFDELDGWWQQQGKAGATKQSPVKRLRGSGRRIKDPFPIMISQASRTLRQAHERMVIDQIIRLSGVHGMGHIIEEVPKNMVPAAHATIEEILDRLEKEFGIRAERMADESAIMTFFAPAQRPDGKAPIVPLYDQGVVRWFEVDPKLYETLSSLDVYRLPDTVGLIGRVLLEWPATLMRAGTTGIRASFGLIWNPLRDIQTMAVNTRSRKMAGRLFMEWGRSMGEMFMSRVRGKNSEWVDAWMALGGEMAQPLGQDIAHTRRASRRLFENRFHRIIDVRNAFDFYRDVVQFPEGAPRVAELRLVAEEIGWKPGTPMSLDQSLELLLASKQVTTDFTAAGSFARMMNRMVPFFNAAIQGPRANVRAFKRNPSQFVARGLELTVVTLLLWWLYKDEEWWKSMPLRERFMHWHFPIDINGKEELVRIPRAFEIGMIFGALPEMLADAWYRDEPEQVKEWFSTLTDVSAPEYLPVLGQVSMEQWRNRQWPDRPIVPRSVEQKPAEEQFNEYTSKAAILLGDIFEKSPMRIDHIIEGVGGPVAGDLLEALGVGPAEIEREEEPADAPLVGRLFQRGGRMGIQPRQIENLYDVLAEAQLKQHSDRHPETRDERKMRLQLEDAAKAVSALILVRRYTKGYEDRKRITAQARELAERALAAHEGGRRDRAEFAGERKKAQINRRRVEAGKEPIQR